MNFLALIECLNQFIFVYIFRMALLTSLLVEQREVPNATPHTNINIAFSGKYSHMLNVSPATKMNITTKPLLGWTDILVVVHKNKI